MYEVPTLSTVGKAEEVVRGVISTGVDCDGLWIPDGQEFQDDELNG